jgi:hypothetical protein
MKSARGYALVLVLGISLMLTIGIGTMLEFLAAAQKTSGRQRQNREAFYVCDGVARALTATSAASVSSSQPWPAWLWASWARTVSTVFKSNTPCRAHDSRFPCEGRGIPRSLLSSKKILTREGGGGVGGFTEKHRPCA